MRKQCPKCGGTHVQLSMERSKHGCFWFIMFGMWFILWRIVKYCIGFIVLICFDWYMALIAKLLHRGYVWRCKGWFSGREQLYYCHTCGYNFRQ